MEECTAWAVGTQPRNSWRAAKAVGRGAARRRKKSANGGIVAVTHSGRSPVILEVIPDGLPALERETKMPQVDENIFIKQTPQTVFDYLIQAENLPVWDVSVVKAEQVDQNPVGLGTRTKGASKIMGKQFDWTTEITTFEPASQVAWTSVDGGVQFSVNYVLAPEAGGTRVTVHLEAQPGLGGVFGRMTDPFIAKVQARTMRANLETLADLLAQESAT